MSTTVKITLVEVAPGGQVEKLSERRPNGSQYAFPVLYTLEDGRKLRAMSYHRLRRSAVDAFSCLPAPPKYPMNARFTPSGQFECFEQVIKIGGGRG